MKKDSQKGESTMSCRSRMKDQPQPPLASLEANVVRPMVEQHSCCCTNREDEAVPFGSETSTKHFKSNPVSHLIQRILSSRGTPSWKRSALAAIGLVLFLCLLPAVLLPGDTVHSLSQQLDKVPKTTLVLMGYSPRRKDNYRLLFETYGKMDCILDRVLFLWNNLDEDPPIVPSDTRVEIKLLRQKKNSMNNRLGPDVTDYTRTTSIVLADDDMLLSAALLVQLSHAWSSNRKGIVGVREDMRVVDPGYKFSCSLDTNWFAQRNCYRALFDPFHLSFRIPNLVIGKTLVVGTEFLNMYQQDQIIQDYVDNTFHCEDIFINALVMNATGAAPSMVTSYRKQLRTVDPSNLQSGNFRVDLDDAGGLSKDQWVWLDGRQECVRWAKQHFSESVWKPSSKG